jgi:hypothetical protein
MPGSCTAAEVTWLRQTSEHAQEAQGTAGGLQLAVKGAPLVGFGVFMQAACVATGIIWAIAYGRLSATPQLLSSCWDLVADAATLVASPSAGGLERTVMLGEEGLFVQRVRMLERKPGLWMPTTDAAQARAMEAWHGVQRSGVLQDRIMDQTIARERRLRGESLSAAAAARTAPERRHCALVSCSAREAHPAHFKSCAACRIPVYCCKEHQTEDWPAHKTACKAAQSCRLQLRLVGADGPSST